MADILTPVERLALYQVAREEMEANGDRTMVIVAVSLLEEAIAQAVANALNADVLETKYKGETLYSRIFGERGAMATLSAKIDMLFALGLVDRQAYVDLHTVRRIRNVFAHEVGVSFSDQSIADLAANLSDHGHAAEIADLVPTDLGPADFFFYTVMGVWEDLVPIVEPPEDGGPLTVV